MKSKKLLIFFGGILMIVVGTFIYIFILPWFLLWLGLMLMPNPPKPEIRYGEFPFKLTYELDGEIQCINDVAVCEFDGYYERTEAGQARKWKTYLKSDVDNPDILEEIEQILLLDLRNEKVFDDAGHRILKFYFFGGSGHYYMGDKLGPHSFEPQNLSEVCYMYENENGELRHGSIKAEEALEKYKIRLISWEVAPPITNSFGRKTLFKWR